MAVAATTASSTTARSPYHDPQRHRVYGAERLVKLFWKELHPERAPIERRLGWEALCGWCETVYEDALVRPYAHQWRTRRVRPALAIERSEVTYSYARPWDDGLAFTDGGCNTWVVLHEVAHLLTRRTGESAHGCRFATVLQQMVERWLDPVAAAMLGRVYAYAGVRERRMGRGGEVPYVMRQVVEGATLHEAVVERLAWVA